MNVLTQLSDEREQLRAHLERIYKVQQSLSQEPNPAAICAVRPSRPALPPSQW